MEEQCLQAPSYCQCRKDLGAEGPPKPEESRDLLSAGKEEGLGRANSMQPSRGGTGRINILPSRSSHADSTILLLMLLVDQVQTEAKGQHLTYRLVPRAKSREGEE